MCELALSASARVVPRAPLLVQRCVARDHRQVVRQARVGDRVVARRHPCRRARWFRYGTSGIADDLVVAVVLEHDTHTCFSRGTRAASACGAIVATTASAASSATGGLSHFVMLLSLAPFVRCV